MPPKLSPQTKRLVEKLFSPSQVPEATQWLEDECGNNLSSCEAYDEYQMERIRFAAIKLSQGDMMKLLAAIDEARMDWRDLFMAADFGQDVNAHVIWAKEILDR